MLGVPSADELDDLVTRLEAVSKAMVDAAELADKAADKNLEAAKLQQRENNGTTN